MSIAEQWACIGAERQVSQVTACLWSTQLNCSQIGSRLNGAFIDWHDGTWNVQNCTVLQGCSAVALSFSWSLLAYTTMRSDQPYFDLWISQAKRLPIFSRISQLMKTGSLLVTRLPTIMTVIVMDVSWIQFYSEQSVMGKIFVTWLCHSMSRSCSYLSGKLDMG